LDGSGLSKENYDALLAGWAGQTLQNDLDLGASGVTYCNAVDGRQRIIESYGWRIQDGGRATTCPTFPVVRSDREVTVPGQPVTTAVLENDTLPGGQIDTSTVRLESGPDDGTVAVNETGTLTYQPAEGFAGKDSYIYTVADQEGDRSEKATVSVSVLRQNVFATTWETTTFGESVKIPTNGQGVSRYNFTIDWGDGTTEQYSGQYLNPTHTYSQPGMYVVTISGTFPRISLSAAFSDSGDRSNARRLQSIEQWGDIQWESFEDAFAEDDLGRARAEFRYRQQFDRLVGELPE
jgi:hypothetical protein